jgi:hypothetical protein
MAAFGASLSFKRGLDWRPTARYRTRPLPASPSTTIADESADKSARMGQAHRARNHSAFVCSAPCSGAHRLIAQPLRIKGPSYHALPLASRRAGWFLRHFLELGINDDGRGRRVFDGVIITLPAPARYLSTIASARWDAPRPSRKTGFIPKTVSVRQCGHDRPILAPNRRILHCGPTGPLGIETNGSAEY